MVVGNSEKGHFEMTESERRKLEKKSTDLSRQLTSLSTSKAAIDAQLESAMGGAVDGLRAELMDRFNVQGEVLNTLSGGFSDLSNRVAALERFGTALDSPAVPALPVPAAVVPEDGGVCV